MLKFKSLITTLAIFAFLSADVTAQLQEEELGIFEKLDEYIPSDLVFVNENFDTVNLLDRIDKPTVIVPVYYECPGLCSPLLEGVADVIGKASVELGKDYQVFTIREKKETYAKLVKSNADLANGWIFHTGDSINIVRLLNSIGYKVKKTGRDYIHPGAVIVLSPDGKITRYLHGTYFLPFDLKMAIVEASQGRSGPTINKVLQFCFSYDPEGKKYVFNITKVSGGIILFFALLFLVTLILKSRKSKQQTSES